MGKGSWMAGGIAGGVLGVAAMAGGIMGLVSRSKLKSLDATVPDSSMAGLVKDFTKLSETNTLLQSIQANPEDVKSANEVVRTGYANFEKVKSNMNDSVEQFRKDATSLMDGGNTPLRLTNVNMVILFLFTVVFFGFALYCIVQYRNAGTEEDNTIEYK